MNYLFIDPEALIRYGGLLVLILIVFGSTGLFFCFFLPTGAVLFAAGVMIASGSLNHNLFTVCFLLTLSSVLGNITGYWFGKKTGPLLYKKKDSEFFHKKHLITAEAFYKKHGALTLTIGMFLPIIRTFAPVVAGMIKMKFLRFIFLIVIGSVAWILSFILIGYFIGSRPQLKPWLNYIVIIFILIVTIPLLIKIVKEARKLK